MLCNKVIMQKVVGLVVSILLTVLLSRCGEARKLDCTKFVFAPKCRGVAAKRGVGEVQKTLSPTFSDDTVGDLLNRLKNIASLEAADGMYSQKLMRLTNHLTQDLAPHRPVEEEEAEENSAQMIEPLHELLRRRWSKLRESLLRNDRPTTDKFDDFLEDKLHNAYFGRNEGGEA